MQAARRDDRLEAGRIAEHFELGGSPRLSDGPVARGKQGQVWRLETTAGRWAVKSTFDHVAEEATRPATDFQDAARAAGVPTPQVMRTTDGHVFADLGEQRVRVFEWVEVGTPDPLLDPERVGEVLAALHQLPSDGAGQPSPWHQDPVGADRWDRLIADLRRAGAPFADRLAGLRDELVALEEWLEPPRSVRTCHRDLWADNVLPSAGDVCVLDFEETGPADPSQELGYVLFEFGRTDPGRARALVDAYRRAGGSGVVEQPGDFSMLIASLGHITEIAGRDWLRPNDRSPERADAAAWIGEVLDEPHTTGLLRALLRTVGGR